MSFTFATTVVAMACMPFSAFKDIFEMPQAALHNSKVLNLASKMASGSTGASQLSTEKVKQTAACSPCVAADPLGAPAILHPAPLRSKTAFFNQSELRKRLTFSGSDRQPPKGVEEIGTTLADGHQPTPQNTAFRQPVEPPRIADQIVALSFGPQRLWPATWCPNFLKGLVERLFDFDHNISILY